MSDKRGASIGRFRLQYTHARREGGLASADSAAGIWAVKLSSTLQEGKRWVGGGCPPLPSLLGVPRWGWPPVPIRRSPGRRWSSPGKGLCLQPRPAETSSGAGKVCKCLQPLARERSWDTEGGKIPPPPPPEGRKIRSRGWPGVIRERLRRRSRYLRGEKLSLAHGEKATENAGTHTHRVPSALGMRRSAGGGMPGVPAVKPRQHPPKPAREGRRGRARPPPGSARCPRGSLPASPDTLPATRGWGEAVGGRLPEPPHTPHTPARCGGQVPLQPRRPSRSILRGILPPAPAARAGRGGEGGGPYLGRLLACFGWVLVCVCVYIYIYM